MLVLTAAPNPNGSMYLQQQQQQQQQEHHTVKACVCLACKGIGEWGLSSHAQEYNHDLAVQKLLHVSPKPMQPQVVQTRALGTC
jgi:hypothetical protein